MFVWLQATAPAGTPSWASTFTGNRIMREGLIAGARGAAAVALGFLAMRDELRRERGGAVALALPRLPRTGRPPA